MRPVWIAAATALIVVPPLLYGSRYYHRPAPLGGTRHAYTTQAHPIKTKGGTLYGELLLPNDRQGKLSVAICAHDFGSSYAACENLIGRSLAMSGYGVYCFDFRGGSKNSKSDGSMVDMSLLTEEADLLAVIDHIKSLDWVDTERLYLLGESQGGLVSALAAPQRETAIRAMILYYPAFCIPEDMRKRFQRIEEIPDEVQIFDQTVGKRYCSEPWDWDVYEKISGYTGPVLIVHGDADQTVKVSYSRKALSYYANARLEELPGEIHGFYGKGKHKAAKRCYEFLLEQGGNK